MVQLQLLNRILSTKDYSLIQLNNFDESYFNQYPREFKFIQTHYNAYNKVPDLETFLSVFNNFEIINVEETDEYLVNTLIEEYKSREMIKTMNEIRDYLNVGDTEKASEIYKESLDRLNKVGVVVKPVNLVTDQTRYDEYVDKIHNYDKYFVSTGLIEIDNILGGGFDKKEELVVIVARPGVGKSFLGLKFAAEAALRGQRVGFYSGEMTESKVGTRFDTTVGHINNGGIMHGNVSFQVEYKEYLDNLRKTCPGDILVITPSMFGGYATVNDLNNFVEKEKLDMLVIDQISLIEDKKGKTSKEKTSNIMIGIKKIQTTKKIPIIAISQQNRTKNENNELDLTQIANADEVGQFATIVIFIERKDNLFTFWFTKVRDGSSEKKLNYNVDLNRGYWVYVPDEKDGVKGQSASLESNYEDRYKPKKEGDYF